MYIHICELIKYCQFFFSSGVVTLSATNPIWVVKTRLCLPNVNDVPNHMRYKGLRGKLKGERERRGRVRWEENKVEEWEMERELQR